VLFVWIAAGVAAFLLIATMVIAFICYRMAFYAKRSSTPATDAIDFPEGDIYVPFYPAMEKWATPLPASMPAR